MPEHDPTPDTFMTEHPVCPWCGHVDSAVEGPDGEEHWQCDCCHRLFVVAADYAVRYITEKLHPCPRCGAPVTFHLGQPTEHHTRPKHTRGYIPCKET